MAAAPSTSKLRLATPDPTLPKPWIGLIDCATGNQFFWNPEMNVSTYVRPATDPQPLPLPQPHISTRSGDVENFRSDNRSHQPEEGVYIGSRCDSINSGNRSHPSRQNIDIGRRSDGININNQSHQNRGSVDIGCRGDGINNGKQNYTNRGGVDICRLGGIINSGNRSHQNRGIVDIGRSNNGINIRDPIHWNRRTTDIGRHSVDNNISDQRQVAGRDIYSKLIMTSQQCAPALEGSGKEYRIKQEICLGAKRKNTNKFHTETKTVRKKEKTTSSAVLEASDGQIQESVIKPKMKGKEKINQTDVKEDQQELVDGIDDKEPDCDNNGDISLIVSRGTTILVNEEELATNNILRSDLLAMAEPKVKRSEIIEMSPNSPICMALVAKEMGMPLPELVPIGVTEPILELWTVADGTKVLDELMIDSDGLMEQDGGSIKEGNSNFEADSQMTDEGQKESVLAAKIQLIQPSSSTTVHNVVAELPSADAAIDRLGKVVELMRNEIGYTRSASETIFLLQQENKELEKRIADLDASMVSDREKLKERIENLIENFLDISFWNLVCNWRKESDLAESNVDKD